MDLAGTIGKLFVERRDVYAIQYPNGHYEPCKEKIGRAVVDAHLAGTRTIGHYLVSTEDRCRLFAFDIDLRGEHKDPETKQVVLDGVWTDEEGEQHAINPRKVWLDPRHPARSDLLVQLRCMAEGLAYRVQRTLDIPVAVAYSGNKGVHVYGFTGSEEASIVRGAAIDLLEGWCFEPSRGQNFYRHSGEQYPNLDIEVFPKQDKVGEGGFGNLMRLPLGINQKTKQEGFFLDMTSPVDEFRKADPAEALSGKPW